MLASVVAAIAVIGTLQWIFYRSAWGRAFRATSDNQDIAQLMGLNKSHVFGLAMALALVVVAIAGIFLGIRTSFDPSAGPGRLIFGFDKILNLNQYRSGEVFFIEDPNIGIGNPQVTLSVGNVAKLDLAQFRIVIQRRPGQSRVPENR